jgi:hypothetical protein
MAVKALRACEEEALPRKETAPGAGVALGAAPFFHTRSARGRAAQVPCDMGAFYATGPNPHVLEGALVSGPAFANDAYQDQRSLVNSRVALDYSAGFTSAPPPLATCTACIEGASRRYLLASSLTSERAPASLQQVGSRIHLRGSACSLCSVPQRCAGTVCVRLFAAGAVCARRPALGAIKSITQPSAPSGALADGGSRACVWQACSQRWWSRAMPRTRTALRATASSTTCGSTAPSRAATAEFGLFRPLCLSSLARSWDLAPWEGAGGAGRVSGRRQGLWHHAFLFCGACLHAAMGNRQGAHVGRRSFDANC